MQAHRPWMRAHRWWMRAHRPWMRAHRPWMQAHRPWKRVHRWWVQAHRRLHRQDQAPRPRACQPIRRRRPSSRPRPRRCGRCGVHDSSGLLRSAARFSCGKRMPTGVPKEAPTDAPPTPRYPAAPVPLEAHRCERVPAVPTHRSVRRGRAPPKRTSARARTERRRVRAADQRVGAVKRSAASAPQRVHRKRACDIKSRRTRAGNGRGSGGGTQASTQRRRALKASGPSRRKHRGSNGSNGSSTQHAKAGKTKQRGGRKGGRHSKQRGAARIRDERAHSPRQRGGDRARRRCRTRRLHGTVTAGPTGGDPAVAWPR